MVPGSIRQSEVQAECSDDMFSLLKNPFSTIRDLNEWSVSFVDTSVARLWLANVLCVDSVNRRKVPVGWRNIPMLIGFS